MRWKEVFGVIGVSLLLFSVLVPAARCFPLPSQTDVQPKNAQVKVKVISDYNGQPVPSATVTLYIERYIEGKSVPRVVSGHTNAEGIWMHHFTNITAINEIEVQKGEPFELYKGNVDWNGEETLEITVKLKLLSHIEKVVRVLENTSLQMKTKITVYVYSLRPVVKKGMVSFEIVNRYTGRVLTKVSHEIKGGEYLFYAKKKINVTVPLDLSSYPLGVTITIKSKTLDY
ncbi:MAG TPA: hypothetical protein ENG60_03730, partial [Thermoplasmatales archaeon]|nr:hypothetical protein [Thermoplasmatales archaeon]HEX17499.1 hypothetical protein [Thermoplasmatales archaeon]